MSATTLTIGDLRREGRGLYAYCVECGRERTLDPRRVALADALTVPEAGGKLKCRDCGGRRIFVMPAEPAAADQVSERGGADTTRGTVA